MGILNRARKFADKAHEGQTRKYTEEPYVFHPVNVAMLLLEVPHDDNMLAAALLHDVVEDTTVSIHTISKEFGADVADLVADLTDISMPSDGNRAVRKYKDLVHTSEASPRAKTIKLADLIDNSESITRHDPGFAKVYMKEKLALLDVLKAGDPKLYARACEIVENYYQEQGV